MDSETGLGASEQDHTKGDSCSLLLLKTWAVKDTADGNRHQHPPTKRLDKKSSAEHCTLLPQEPGPFDPC